MWERVLPRNATKPHTLPQSRDGASSLSPSITTDGTSLMLSSTESAASALARLSKAGPSAGALLMSSANTRAAAVSLISTDCDFTNATNACLDAHEPPACSIAAARRSASVPRFVVSSSIHTRRRVAAILRCGCQYTTRARHLIRGGRRSMKCKNRSRQRLESVGVGSVYKCSMIDVDCVCMHLQSCS